MKSEGQTVLFVGDLSYADRYQFNDVGLRWDTWGRFAEQSAAYQPWIWSAGNHEIEYMPYMVKIFMMIFYYFCYMCNYLNHFGMSLNYVKIQSLNKIISIIAQ